MTEAVTIYQAIKGGYVILRSPSDRKWYWAQNMTKKSKKFATELEAMADLRRHLDEAAAKVPTRGPRCSAP